MRREQEEADRLGRMSLEQSLNGVAPVDLLILPAPCVACWTNGSAAVAEESALAPSAGFAARPPTLPASPAACIRPLCSQYFACGLPWQHSLWAISFSWCGKIRSEPAAVDVERLAQDAAAHGRAFDMPAGPAFAPGAVPRGLARLGAFPEGEIGGRTLSLGHLAPFALQAVERATAELAVFRIAADVEIDVAVGDIGKALLDQRCR